MINTDTAGILTFATIIYVVSLLFIGYVIHKVTGGKSLLGFIPKCKNCGKNPEQAEEGI